MSNVAAKGSRVIIVGLVGSTESGKRLVSNFLHYSYGFIKINFSDKVEEVADILGKRDRESLREIELAMRRRLGRDVWVRLLEGRIEEELSSMLIKSYAIPGVSEVRGVLKVVIEDIKHSNELDFVKERKGLLIGLRASKETLYERLKKTDKSLSYKEFKKRLRHPSEKEISHLIEECDFIIDTDDLPPREIEEKVDKIVRRRFIEGPLHPTERP